MRYIVNGVDRGVRTECVYREPAIDATYQDRRLAALLAFVLPDPRTMQCPYREIARQN